jgi:EAL domain-containing protein (putative c-di-GMP-specific phosphodiesterase class I)
VGVEALSRLIPDPPQAPDRWFNDAGAVGMRLELELVAIREALGFLERLPVPSYLSVNVSPQTILCARLLDLFEGGAGRVVLELTEHMRVEDYSVLNAALDPFRDRGARIAVDDAGAGFSSFRHVMLLEPDIIKLDLSITRGIDADPDRRTLASAFISFASELGAAVVAEGIETQKELVTMRALGARFGQGYHLARPGPFEALKFDPKATDG